MSMASIQELLPLAAARLHTGTVDGGGGPAQRRLGGLVVARRVQLGYRKRPAFSEVSGISVRILGDIETGRRSNFDRSTIAALEHALRWTSGSVAQVLAGGEPTDACPPAVPLTPAGVQQPDEALVRVMRDPRLSTEQKRRLVRLLIAEREAAERLRVEHAEEMIWMLLEQRG